MSTTRPPRSAAREKAPARAQPAFVDTYLPYLLARASHLISGEFHAELARRKVPVINWRILASLWETRALTLTELAEVVVIKQPTCSRAVTRMEALGLVCRTVHADDRRSIRVALTDAGRALAEPLVEAARHHERDVRGPLGASRERTLVSVLQQLIRDHGGSPSTRRGRP
jgi:DNA-binding MarR family transcriptional regulator